MTHALASSLLEAVIVVLRIILRYWEAGVIRSASILFKNVGKCASDWLNFSTSASRGAGLQVPSSPLLAMTKQASLAFWAPFSVKRTLQTTTLRTLPLRRKRGR